MLHRKNIKFMKMYMIEFCNILHLKNICLVLFWLRMTLVSPIWNDILALILFYLLLRRICTEKSVKNYLDTVLREKIKYSVFSFTSE